MTSLVVYAFRENGTKVTFNFTPRIVIEFDDYDKFVIPSNAISGGDVCIANISTTESGSQSTLTSCRKRVMLHKNTIIDTITAPKLIEEYMKILYIDATVRSNSRTAILAEYLLKNLSGEISRVKLCDMSFPVVDETFLAMRDKACNTRDFSSDIFAPAKQFAEADVIVIAAPFWDLSFPSTLKQYFEQINVVGLTFAYSEDGRPIGLCKAKKLFYVTTAGGKILGDEYGYGYVKALAQNFYGINDVQLIKAEGLDINGADTEKIIRRAENDIDRLFDNND